MQKSMGNKSQNFLVFKDSARHERPSLLCKYSREMEYDDTQNGKDGCCNRITSVKSKFCEERFIVDVIIEFKTVNVGMDFVDQAP